MATPGNLTITGGNNQSVVAGSNFANPVTVEVTDTTGALMPNEPVVWSVPQSGPSGIFVPTGGVAPITTYTSPFGISSVPFKANAQVGAWQGLVQASNRLSLSATYNLTNGGVGPVQPTWLAGQDQKIAINTAAVPWKVLVTNASGTPLSGIAIRFDTPPGMGTFSNGFTTYDAFSNTNGEATSLAWTASAAPNGGTVTVTTPNNGGIAPLTTSLTTVNPAVVTRIVVQQGSGQAAPINTPFPTALYSIARNDLGNGVSGVNVQPTVPASGASCTGLIGGVSDANGWVYHGTPTANGITGNYNVTCASAAFPSATPANFNLTNGAQVVPPPTPAMAMCVEC
jgi:hypothetical protein